MFAVMPSKRSAERLEICAEADEFVQMRKKLKLCKTNEFLQTDEFAQSLCKKQEYDLADFPKVHILLQE